MVVARYNTTSGLAGCYIPDNVGERPLEFTRRKDLYKHIAYELERLEWPKSLLNEINIVAIWKFIKRNGSSSAHFSIHHKGYVLEFHGLTEEEFAQQEREHEFA